ncbi:MAG: hypothetical protein S4CHLAM123_07540 [Chlamydiales bacterium]|nr:hypothetical protein [Chlamydiales bacterium]
MGIADLIPGISGGTIAFITGIYDDLLIGIKTLQLQSLKKVSWAFLLPLGAGIATAVVFCSKLIYFLILHHKAPLYALFFGCVVASAFSCGKKASIQRLPNSTALFVGVCISLFLTSLPEVRLVDNSFFWILFSSMLGACAMLLPGISGSLILQLMGVYPLMLFALAQPSAPGALKILLGVGLGVSLGFVLFARAVSFLLAYFRQITLALLVGFMIGGLKALWPYREGNMILSTVFILIGFFSVILLDIKSQSSRVSN